MPSTRSSTTPKKSPAKKVESAYFKKKRASNGSSSRPAKRAKRADASSDEEDDADEGDEYKEDEEEEDTALSDALDDSDFDEKAKRKIAKTPTKRKSVSAASSPTKGNVEVIGKVVEAPKTGRVPPGRISKNTMDFLMKMTDPKCNDRDWFRLHEPIYRLAEKEWVDFVDQLIPKLCETDDQLPLLPPKDLIYRFYRDIRFSNDKTPYKKGFSASVSRSGRKGIFAGYFIAVQPGNHSLIAAGVWCPGKNELASIRHHITHDSSRLREIISSKPFVKHFGPPKPDAKGGKRQNVFGREDELKTAPKGVDKNAKDIDLLKLRSVAVNKYFTDEEVLSPNFISHLCEIAAAMRPLVHCLNDYMTLPVESDNEEDENDEDRED